MKVLLVVRQMATNLETADRLVREIEPASAGGTGGVSDAAGRVARKRHHVR